MVRHAYQEGLLPSALNPPPCQTICPTLALTKEVLGKALQGLLELRLCILGGLHGAPVLWTQHSQPLHLVEHRVVRRVDAVSPAAVHVWG